MTKLEFFFDSSDGATQVHALAWLPDGKPSCIVQIIHGMAEYAGRYERLAEFLTGKGILVTGNDHLGHGKSVGKDHPYGYFCSENAPERLVEDVHRLRERTQAEYPGVLYVMIGHSMGSFILRNYLCRYADGLAGAIIMGTGMQPERMLRFSMGLVRFLTAFQGETHKSELVNRLAFGNYNRRISHPLTVMDWLSKDAVEVARYNEDPLCGFTFTLNGFAGLFGLILNLYDKDRLEKMPKELPLRFLSGSEDPVGDYGKAVERVFARFGELGMRNVSLRLFENDRHELVNETDRELVFQDIFSWICQVTGAGNF